MRRRSSLVAGLVALAVVVTAPPTTATARASSAASLAPAHAAPGPGRSASRPRTPLETETGLTMVITGVSPAGLTPGRPLRLSGTVSNIGEGTWTDAQVYLSIDSEPAVSKAALDSFAADEDGFSTTINTLGRFDVIGALTPGSRTNWHLAVPFGALRLNGAGVYRVGGTLLASNADGRDHLADARAGTTIPYLPGNHTPSGPTSIVTLVPVTAAVLRRPDGIFLDDSLAALLSPGGQLRNLLDFAAQAPAGSLELVVDPALRQAVQAMSNGYVVQSFDDQAQGTGPRPGLGQQEAAVWLADLGGLQQHQRMTLLPWGDPATVSLADAGLPSVVNSAVVSSQRYASVHSLNPTVVDWQSGGASRRALAVSRLAGAAVHVVSEASLPGLSRSDLGSYPPDQVSIGTGPGPLTAVVTRRDVGGERFVPNLTALDFRQAMMAEATVRSLSEDHHPTSVITAPLQWNPGNLSSQVDVAAGFAYPTVAPESLSVLAEGVPQTYRGSVLQFRRSALLPTSILAATKRLRANGRVYTDLLTDHRQAAISFDQQLAEAGSSVWRWQPKRGTALILKLSRGMAEQIAKVTVTGPSFVAMSSDTGRFPLTVSNGLDVGVAVKISVHPFNKALKIAGISSLHLAAGQSRDIDVESRAEGSGLTQVRARLSTITDRSFGRPFNFNIRATQIGLAIWIAMGLGLAVLFISAARRIYSRARGQGFKTRAESSG